MENAISSSVASGAGNYYTEGATENINITGLKAGTPYYLYIGFFKNRGIPTGTSKEATFTTSTSGSSTGYIPIPIPTPEPSPTPDPEPAPDITPDPTPEPSPEPDSTPEPEQQDPAEYTNEQTGEVIPDMVEVPAADATGAEIEKRADGTVTVTDPLLGEADNMSPAVFAEGGVYRLYNPATGEHFYTKNPDERNYLAQHGWNYEADQTTRTIGANEKDAMPVYRVYNPNSGLHHFTMDRNEAHTLKNIGWSYEGISLYAYESRDTKGAPMYRLYHPEVGQHHYTADTHENGYLQTVGWRGEGPAWRVKN